MCTSKCASLVSFIFNMTSSSTISSHGVSQPSSPSLPWQPTTSDTSPHTTVVQPSRAVRRWSGFPYWSTFPLHRCFRFGHWEKLKRSHLIEAVSDCRLFERHFMRATQIQKSQMRSEDELVFKTCRCHPFILEHGAKSRISHRMVSALEARLQSTPTQRIRLKPRLHVS